MVVIQLRGSVVPAAYYLLALGGRVSMSWTNSTANLVEEEVELMAVFCDIGRRFYVRSFCFLPLVLFCFFPRFCNSPKVGNQGSLWLIH